MAWNASWVSCGSASTPRQTAQDHRPVPLDQDGEGQLGGLAPVGREPFQELAVRQVPDRSHVEEGAELPEDSPILSDRHDWESPPSARPSERYE